MARFDYKALSLRRVLETYSGFHGGAVATRDLLALHLREGTVRARYAFAFESRETTADAAWKEARAAYRAHRTMEEKQLKNITRSKWWRSMDWAGDRENWTLRESGICITTKTEPLRRTMMLGVRFHGGEAKRALDPNYRDHKNKGVGVLNNKEAWREFWFEIISMIQNGSTDFGLLQEAGSTAEVVERFVFEGDGDKNGSGELLDDDPVADALSRRVPIRLSEESIRQEVNALRKRFGLTRKYQRR